MRAFCRQSGRTALTLIEVVAGIALLATLLVSILTTHQLHADQVRSAQDRLTAIRLANDLLATWSVGGELPAIGTEEELPGMAGWRWRIVKGEPVAIGRYSLQVVRFEVVRSSADRSERVLTAVDLLAGATNP